MQYAIVAALVALLAVLAVIGLTWGPASFNDRIDRRARRRQRFARDATEFERHHRPLKGVATGGDAVALIPEPEAAPRRTVAHEAWTRSLTSSHTTQSL
jgi:hypothetical protein